MPQRISDEELKLILTNWKFAAVIKLDLKRNWLRELAEDLAKARAALKIAVEALESLTKGKMVNCEAIARTALDRIKQIGEQEDGSHNQE